jgi:peptide/nickel transport system substrate-binding protein
MFMLQAPCYPLSVPENAAANNGFSDLAVAAPFCIVAANSYPNARIDMKRLIAPWLAFAMTLALTIAAQAQQDSIVISAGADPTGVNALDQITVVPDRSLTDHIADSLLKLNAAGEPGPWLATSYRNVDPVTWELKLREGVKFHNGEVFDAETVKFFYDTMNDPKLQSPTKTNHTFVKGVEIVDPYTVRIITKEPYPLAPLQFTYANAMPPKYVREVGYDGYRKKPIGTGPYVFVEHVRDDHLTMRAFDGYWGGPQRFKTITYRPIKEDSARVASLLAGETDIVMDVPPELMPVIAQSRVAKPKTVQSARSAFLILNELDPAMPTANRDVREAINYAIDRETINKTILGGTGAAAAWINPAMFGQNPDIKPIAYNPERAKELLAAAGYANGFDTTLDATEGKFLKDREIAEAVAGQLAKVGIRATVRTYEWGLFSKRMFSHQASPLALMTWSEVKGDPDSHNRLQLLKGGTWSQTDDPKLDEIIRAIEREMDRDKRKALIFQLQDYMRQSFPTAYLVQLGGIYGVSNRADWWSPRPDDKVLLFQNNVVK